MNGRLFPFVGRPLELQQLKSSIASARPTISVIYGRRRVGKSALIRQALEGHRALLFEGLE